MLKKSFLVIPAISILLAASCAKEGPSGPTGPAGPSFTGTVTGDVSLYDKYGSNVLTGLLNLVNISMSSKTIAAISTAIDSNGLYTYVNVVTGTYTISANADSDYAGTVLSNVNFVSGTLYQDIKLSAIPDSFITSFASYLNTGSLTDSLALTVKSDARERNCIVFLSKAKTVSNDPNFYLLKYRIDIPGSTNTVAFTIPQQDLLDAGFTSGSKVFYAAYSYVVNDGSVYEDPTTGRNIYNAVNATPIVDSALVP